MGRGNRARAAQRDVEDQIGAFGNKFGGDRRDHGRGRRGVAGIARVGDDNRQYGLPDLLSRHRADGDGARRPADYHGLLTGPAFYANWEGESLNALFERIRMSMPLDNPGSLSRAQNADVVAHMLRIGGYPAGTTALEGQAGTLTGIKVLTYKP